jgi:replicative DNA helicase
MPSKAKALPGTGEEIARLEDAVLGSLLFGRLSWEAFSQCDAEDLRAEDLGRAAPSGTVAEAPTTLSLCEWLTSRGTDGACGGLSYVIRVADVAGGSSVEIRHLISRVKEAARRRAAYQTARALLEAR